jgi:anti-sigma B factor antagonist
MTLSCAIEAGDGSAVVRLHGRIDRDAATTFDGLASATRDAAAIELDFGDVDYINSTGIALIVGLLAQARARRARVSALGLTPHYQHIFEITRLSDFIEIVQPAEP